MSLVRNAILAQLQADTGAGGVATLATGGIFPDQAPELIEQPFVIVAVETGESPSRVFQDIAYESSRILVRATVKGISPKDAAAINRRVRTVLENAALTITGYATLLCEWAGNIPGFPETDDGAQYRHEGSLYNVWASEN